MTHPPSFTGTWTLQDWTSLKDGAPAGYPMGPDALGQIIYAQDGHMCAFLMRSNFKDQTGTGTADTCLSYGGAWYFEEGRISHEVAFSNLPHWIGRTLVRIVARDGDTMTLRTDPEFSKSGSKYEHLLVWQRVQAPD